MPSLGGIDYGANPELPSATMSCSVMGTDIYTECLGREIYGCWWTRSKRHDMEEGEKSLKA